METGQFFDISNDDYHNDTTAISKSNLDEVRKSAMHYYESNRARNEGRVLQTDPMRFGSAFHTFVLEPEKYKTEYVTMPGVNLRTNAGKAEKAQFLRDFETFEIVTKEEKESLESMRDVIMGNPTTSKLLSDGIAETTFVWIDEETGLKCKCRPDYYNNSEILVDLKTTKCAASYDFSKAVFDYRYHVQSGFYCDGVSAVMGTPHEAFVFIAIEKTYPFKMSVYHLDAASMAKGREQYREDLLKIKSITESDNYVEPISLPHWAL